MSTKPPKPTIAEVLREALGERKESLRAVERATGVPHPSLIRFLRGELRLRLDMADKLAAHFGVEVRRPRRRNVNRKGERR